jgi:YegS/Rv2252/BmrU family lipid kinase
MSKKLLLIVNPKAGQKKCLRYLSDIIALFNRADYTVITHITAGPGDGKTAVMQYAQELSLVVCCGGDGTFNETLSGVIESGYDIPIGYIPAGSTNDLATSLGLSSNVMQAARDIVAGNLTELDVGEFSGRHFSYIASFGAFTKTSYSTPQELKNAFGHAAYILSGMQELAQIKPYHLKLTLDDDQTVEGDFIFGAVSNSTRFGGVLTLSEKLVDLRDGKLEVLLVRPPKDVLELADCIRALQNQTYDSPMLTFQKAAKVQISAPETLDWTLDGEKQPGMENITVNCLHKAIKIFHK